MTFEKLEDLTKEQQTQQILKKGIHFFFDIDNCLYHNSANIFPIMRLKIRDYFAKTLNLSLDEATKLHLSYYKTYGMALAGLMENYDIDPMDYNEKVDDALPLEDILKPDLKLREMLIKLRNVIVNENNGNGKLWLFTNAYKNHGLRVVKILGIDDLFDGITYCNYAEYPLVCKPMRKSFERAMDESGLDSNNEMDLKRCYFVDDSYINIKAANEEMKWGKCIHYVENENERKSLIKTGTMASDFIIGDILELIDVVPELFSS